MTDKELAKMGAESAVTYALYQAILAPSHDQAMESADLAGKIAAKNGMNASDIRRCGKDAKKTIDAEVPR
tara:strand:- start:20 stop:229 length:210 start_codon:yes stop_codon:yes gene_type:complete